SHQAAYPIAQLLGARCVVRGHGEHGQFAPDFTSVRDHPLGVHSDVWGEVGLVDHEQIGAFDSGTTLAGHVTAPRHVDTENLRVHQRGTDRSGEVVTATLDQHHVQRGELPLHVLHGDEICADIVADGGVWASPGFDRVDPLHGQHTRRAQHAGVFVRVDVVGDHRDVHVVGEVFAQRG